MKTLIVIFGVMFAGAANALPGSYAVKCDSLKGAKQVLHVEASAADIDGTDSGFPSHAQVSYGAKVYKDTNDDGTLEKLSLINHAIDGVIDLKYYSDKFFFEVWGVPATVRMGKHSDPLNGSAKFRAHAVTSAEGQDYLESTLDCELNYDGGSAG